MVKPDGVQRGLVGDIIKRSGTKYNEEILVCKKCVRLCGNVVFIFEVRAEGLQAGGHQDDEAGRGPPQGALC